jgi:hypothetical protein
LKNILLFCVLGGLALAYTGAQDKPAWVDSPSAVYPEGLYLAAVGSGRDRRSAETNALGALAAYFRQSVTNTITISDFEQRINGRSTSETRMSQTIEAVSALDTLIGAEIKNTWNDTKTGIWFAAAVMDKARCGEGYAAELDAILYEISTLIDLSGGVEFETISKCQRARERIGKAGVYALILSMLKGPDRQTEVSRLDAGIAAVLAEAKAIPVDVRVRGDVNGRIRSAFAGAFTAEGFRTGSRDSRYAMEVTISFTPAAQGRYFNSRYTVDAVLTDTKTGSTLLSYSAAGRESHPASQEEADNRALTGAEQKIAEEFPALLQAYLDSNQG